MMQDKHGNVMRRKSLGDVDGGTQRMSTLIQGQAKTQKVFIGRKGQRPFLELH